MVDESFSDNEFKSSAVGGIIISQVVPGYI